MEQKYVKELCTESTIKLLNILRENSYQNRIRLTEENFYQLINESIAETLNEGKWLNRMAGLTLGAASLLGGYGTANAQPQADPVGQEQTQISNRDVSKFIKFWKQQGYTHNGVSLGKTQAFVDKMLSSSKNGGMTLDQLVASRGRFAGTFLNDILFVRNGKPLNTKNCDGTDMMYIINKASSTDEQGRPLVGFIVINGEEYFVNIGNLDHWDGL